MIKKFNKNAKTNRDKMAGALEGPVKGFTRNHPSKSHRDFVSGKHGREEGT